MLLLAREIGMRWLEVKDGLGRYALLIFLHLGDSLTLGFCLRVLVGIGSDRLSFLFAFRLIGIKPELLPHTILQLLRFCIPELV